MRFEMPDGKSYLLLLDACGNIPNDESLAAYEAAMKNTRKVFKKFFFNDHSLADAFFNKIHTENFKYLKTKNPKKEWYLYLMLDRRNNLVKIGKSIDPVYREITLQSEVPEIELFFYSQILGDNIDERYFHKIFKEKRVRGEWFSLDENDVDFIKNSFQNPST